MSTTDPAAEAVHIRAAAACELISMIADPEGSVAIGLAVDGSDYVRRLCADFLARHGVTPTYHGDPTRAPLRSVIASRVPWPAHALHGLWPGDRVEHPEHGPGTVLGHSDEVYAERLEVLTGGHLLVDFAHEAEWVAAVDCTVTTRAEPF
jgi:hypothetical protein